MAVAAEERFTVSGKTLGKSSILSFAESGLLSDMTTKGMLIKDELRAFIGITGKAKLVVDKCASEIGGAGAAFPGARAASLMSSPAAGASASLPLALHPPRARTWSTSRGC